MGCSALSKSYTSNSLKRMNGSLLPDGDASEFFIPDLFRWILIGNKNYSNRRKDESFSQFQDINEVDRDLKNVRKGIINVLGAREQDILELKDADCATLNMTMNAIAERVIIDRNQNN